MPHKKKIIAVAFPGELVIFFWIMHVVVMPDYPATIRGNVLLFSFELCTSPDMDILKELRKKSSCYFLLNYARFQGFDGIPGAMCEPCYFLLNYACLECAPNVELHNATGLAIFFWIMRVQVHAGRLGAKPALAIFFWIMHAKSMSSTTLGGKGTSWLAIFFWIMPRLKLPSRSKPLT